MPLYEIEQYELHTQKYRIEASSQAEAIAMLFQGNADPVEGTLEYIEVLDEFGIPIEERRDLAEELQQIGVTVSYAIPSIRSIEVVKA